MTILNALKKFFHNLNGTIPSGNNIADIIKNGAESVQLNNESNLATRMTIAENRISSLSNSVNNDHTSVVSLGTAVANSEADIAVLENNCFRYKDYDVKSFVLKSYTNDSNKRFMITVDDAGSLSATEIAQYEATWNIGNGITTRLYRDGVLMSINDPVFFGDVLTFFAVAPEGRTFSPINVTGVAYEGAPTSIDGMTFTVTTNFTITLNLR